MFTPRTRHTKVINGHIFMFVCKRIYRKRYKAIKSHWMLVITNGVGSWRNGRR
nr:MAG TPA: hypothetical protein [Bacteriophage sp.]